MTRGIKFLSLIIMLSTSMIKGSDFSKQQQVKAFTLGSLVNSLKRRDETSSRVVKPSIPTKAFAIGLMKNSLKKEKTPAPVPTRATPSIPAWKIETQKKRAAEAAAREAAEAAARMLPEITDEPLAEDALTENLFSLLEETSRVPEIFKKLEKGDSYPESFLSYARLLRLIRDITSTYVSRYAREAKWKFEAGSYDTIVHPFCETYSSGFLKNNIPPAAFFEKFEAPAGSKLINIGDLHGSLHSLMRILVMLYTKNLLKNDLTLPENIYLIFNGDLTDRGAYSTEICYIAFLLKVRNPDQVFITTGNHETVEQNDKDGFSAEFAAKFPTTAGKPNLIQQLYRFLPCAIFTGIVDSSTENKVWQQSSHGGFAVKFKAQKDFFSSPEHSFYLPGGDQAIYNWGDIRRSADDNTYGCFNRCDTPVYKDPNNCPDVADFFSDDEVGISIHNRGHQDTTCSISVIPLEKRYQKVIRKSKHRSFNRNSDRSLMHYITMMQSAERVAQGIEHNFFATKIKECRRYLEDKIKTFGMIDCRDLTDAAHTRSFSTTDLLWPIITCTAATSTQYVLDTSCLVTHTGEGSVNEWKFEPLRVDHIPAMTQCYERIQRSDKPLITQPFVLYQQLIINEAGFVQVQYSNQQFETALIDNRSSLSEEDVEGI